MEPVVIRNAIGILSINLQPKNNFELFVEIRWQKSAYLYIDTKEKSSCYIK